MKNNITLVNNSKISLVYKDNMPKIINNIVFPKRYVDPVTKEDYFINFDMKLYSNNNEDIYSYFRLTESKDINNDIMYNIKDLNILSIDNEVSIINVSKNKEYMFNKKNYFKAYDILTDKAYFINNNNQLLSQEKSLGNYYNFLFFLQKSIIKKELIEDKLSKNIYYAVENFHNNNLQLFIKRSEINKYFSYLKEVYELFNDEYKILNTNNIKIIQDKKDNFFLCNNGMTIKENKKVNIEIIKKEIEMDAFSKEINLHIDPFKIYKYDLLATKNLLLRNLFLVEQSIQKDIEILEKIDNLFYNLSLAFLKEDEEKINLSEIYFYSDLYSNNIKMNTIDRINNSVKGLTSYKDLITYANKNIKQSDFDIEMLLRFIVNLDYTNIDNLDVIEKTGKYLFSLKLNKNNNLSIVKSDLTL